EVLRDGSLALAGQVVDVSQVERGGGVVRLERRGFLERVARLVAPAGGEQQQAEIVPSARKARCDAQQLLLDRDAARGLAAFEIPKREVVADELGTRRLLERL